MINTTLFVQALNFFITYFVLRYLFFKPAVTMIDSQDTYERTLRSDIVSQHAHIAHIAQHQQEQWNESKKLLAKKIPDVHSFYQVPMEQVEGVEPQLVSQKLKDTLVGQVEASIIKRAHNV